MVTSFLYPCFSFRRFEYTDETLVEFRKNVLGLEITRVDDAANNNITGGGQNIEVRYEILIKMYLGGIP